MDKEKKNLLVFGYGLAVIIAFFVWRHGAKLGFDLFSWIWLGVAAFLACLTAIDHQRLRPFYAKWMIGAHFIGMIITTVILSLLFYIVFGIAGIVLRIIRKDLLDRALDPHKGSYWIKREQVPFDKAQYTKQF